MTSWIKRVAKEPCVGVQSPNVLTTSMVNTMNINALNIKLFVKKKGYM